MGKLTKTRPVSRRAPCPICGRPTWCLVAINGAYAVCKREESPRPAKGPPPGWIHRLTGDNTFFHSGRSTQSASQTSTRLASLDRRHRVYGRLLYHLSLAEQHRRELLNRGYRSGEVELRDYRSLPLQGRARIALEIQASERLDGVPGFYTGSNERGSYPALAGSPGLFIPVRAPNKHIRGLRIRPDNANGAGKYRWLSSADKPGGIGPDASCHISRPLLLPVEDRTVWITEGEIKADLSAERLGAVVVSIPGVDLWSRALPDLAELLPNGGRIVVALDADWRDKPRVHLALSGLLLACTSLGYETGVAL